MPSGLVSQTLALAGNGASKALQKNNLPPASTRAADFPAHSRKADERGFSCPWSIARLTALPKVSWNWCISSKRSDSSFFSASETE